MLTKHSGLANSTGMSDVGVIPPPPFTAKLGDQVETVKLHLAVLSQL